MNLLVNRHLYLLLVLVIAGCSTPEQDMTGDETPNLLFIITDDQRFDMMGVVNPMLQTPNMDRLATDGVRFEHAFVTTPICAASRASLLTGLVERTHQFTFGTPPFKNELVGVSYPTLLREAGYRTGMVGKFGVRTEPGATDRMFDVFETFAAAPYIREAEDGTMRHLTDITTDRAIEFLRSSDPEAPFALTLSFNAPHADDGDDRQFIWPEALDSLYADVDLPTPPLSDPAFFEALPEFQKEESLNRVRWYWRFDTPEKAEHMTKGHLRMISGVDAGIGRVLDELESLGLTDNTVVILMGDNGYFLGERGYAGKWTPHELSIRVPLVVFDPRTDSRARGLNPSMPVLNIDVAPTLLDLAGIDIPTSMQGKSLVSIVDGRSPRDWRTDFFVEHLFNHPQIPKHEGVRGERYKYARYFEQQPVFEELYDLRNDPQEARNLAENPAYGDVLTEMRRRTDELQTEYGGAYVAPTEQLP